MATTFLINLRRHGMFHLQQHRLRRDMMVAGDEDVSRDQARRGGVSHILSPAAGDTLPAAGSNQCSSQQLGRAWQVNWTLV